MTFVSSANVSLFEGTNLEFAWSTRKTQKLFTNLTFGLKEPLSSDRKAWILTNEQWHSVSCMLGTTWRMAWQLLCEFVMMLVSLSFVYFESCLITPFSSVVAAVGMVNPRSFHSSCYPVTVCVCVCVHIHTYIHTYFLVNMCTVQQHSLHLSWSFYAVPIFYQNNKLI